MSSLASSPTRRRVTAVLAGLAAGLLTLASPAAAQAGPPCDPLTVISPDATIGDHTALIVVSQVFDADQPGWAAVGWTVASDVDAPSVHAELRDGTTVDLGAATFAEEVLRLSLCGSRGATPPGGGGDPSEPQRPDPVVDVDDPATDEPQDRDPLPDPAEPDGVEHDGGDGDQQPGNPTGDGTAGGDANRDPATGGTGGTATDTLPETGPAEHLPTVAAFGAALVAVGLLLLRRWPPRAAERPPFRLAASSTATTSRARRS